MVNVWGTGAILSAPPAALLVTGYSPGNTLPSQYWNWLLFHITKELNNVLTLSAVSQNATVDTQLASVVVNYDLIIDSNAKLNLWCQAVAGQYKRVLIRSGTWTASALSPTAGVLINLDNTGTTYVFAEKGSSIIYSGSYAGTMYGLYHASLATDMSVERFDNVKLMITNTNTSSIGFYNCTNLTNCTGTAAPAGTGTGDGFNSCTNLVNCIGTGTNSGSSGNGFTGCTNLVNCIGTGTGGSFTGTGFNSCTNLTNCTGTGIGGSFGGNGFTGCTNLVNCIGTGTGGSFTGIGFNSCTNLTNCTGTGSTGGSSTGDGFNSCTNLTNCTGTGTGASSTGIGYGFNGCTGVVLCGGQGLASGSGVGYGYFGCKKMQQNKASGASKSATYNTSYADSASGNACADTAAGGYNS